jgi:hypothetical protein
VNGSESIRDEEGVQVSELQQAKSAAISVVREMRSEKCGEVPDGAGWRLAAADQAGALLFTLELDGLR